MVRRNNNNRQPQRNQRRRRRRQRNQPRKPSRAVLPPAKSIFGHLVRNVVQTAWDIAQGVLTRSPDSMSPFDNLDPPKPLLNPSKFELTFTSDKLFSHGWLDRVKALFKEYKLHSLTAHYVPYVGIDAPGEYCMTLFDANQDATPGTFYGGVGAPASIIRPQRMPAKLTWVPTEPDDRNWHDFGDQHTWCTITLFSAESSYVTTDKGKPSAIPANISGKLVFEVDASFRGTTKIPSKLALAPFGSHEYSAYQQIVECTCRKCVINHRLNDRTASPMSDTSYIQSP